VKTKVLVMMLLAAGAVFAQVSVGIRIGAPPPDRVIKVQPRSPGEGYTFVNGYWYPVSGHYKWHDGYWTRPAYAGSHWVAPHHDGKQYFDGYWDGDKGHVNHDHKWDKNNDHNRDYNRDHDHQ
jgi:WXXGXW repeat (2 copies)